MEQDNYDLLCSSNDSLANEHLATETICEF